MMPIIAINAINGQKINAETKNVNSVGEGRQSLRIANLC
jgi:hypothetical protein